MIVKNIEIKRRAKTVLGSMPDIDTDFPGRRRDEIKAYMEERFGKEQVCSLGTYTTFQLKEAISDMARADGIPVQLYRWFTACIGDDKEKTIEEFFKTVCGKEDLKKFVKEHTETFNDMMVILGSPKSQSVHACGTVVLPDGKTSYEWMPVHTQKGLVVTDWEGSEVEEAGFLKEDVLGIIQLDKFEEMLRLIKENHGIDVDIYSLPLDDKQVFEYAGKGWLGDVFQLGSAGLSGYCVKMKPENINELSACVALYRPGPMENNFHNEYILRKNGEKDWTEEMPIGGEEVVENTYGLMLFQEQIMLFCQKLADFNLEKCDSVRKVLGKKLLQKAKEYGDDFVNGYVKKYGSKGVTKEYAENLWKQMEEFAKYSFNKCLHGDEKIYPNELTIKELYEKGVEDIPAVTMGKYGEFIPTKVKGIRYAGKRFIYKIQTSDRATVRCSGNHKFPTPEGHKYAFLLRKGDVLYTYKHGMRVNVEVVFAYVMDAEPTYDVEIDHPEHNFVTGEGVVTCNSHSVCYGMTAYICLWLKVHYPIEYWSATFSFAKDEKIPYYVNEIQQSGEIKIHPVDINKSDVNIVSDYRTSSMYWAFNAVKQCGERAQEYISEEKKKNGPFFSLEEFIDRCVIKGSPVNKSVIENLIFAGAFDELENIQEPKDRLALIEMYRENKRVKVLEDKDLLTNIMKVRKERNNWWWLLQQKRTSGFAFFDYYDLVNEYHMPKLDDETEFQDVSQIKFWDTNSKKTRRAVIGGYVIEIIERKSKKGIFATIVLESNYEFINVTIFPELFEEYGEFLRGSKKNILLVNGVIVWDKFRGEYILQANVNSLFTVLT
jgi:DNA polymerase-3 subunit alpha